ncbi:MAG: DOPA 4,5-dioxygenase family protein [Lautropia sp.]
MPRILQWHAHVYFDADTVDIANEVCERAARELPVARGRMHHRPVGPHPAWSCQLAFGPDAIGLLTAWLTLHRRGLTVFMHPDTGDALPDHRDRAVWFGESRVLDLDALR